MLILFGAWAVGATVFAVRARGTVRTDSKDSPLPIGAPSIDALRSAPVDVLEGPATSSSCKQLVAQVITQLGVAAASARPNIPEGVYPGTESGENAEQLKRCQQGSGKACEDLAVRYEHGADLPYSPVVAARLHEKACGLKESTACSMAGLQYQLGRGVEKDLDRAHQFFKRGCETEASSCYWLGQFLEDQGPFQDLPKAIAAYKKECASRSGVSCTSIADILVSGGPNVPADPEAALGWYETGCDLGHGGGCERAYQLLSGAGPLTPNPTRAAGFLQRACQLGQMSACDTLKSKK
jgi:uncharacterized protein